MSPNFRTIPLLVIALVLFSCGREGKIIHLNAEDAGSSLDLNVGDVMEITLAGNPSTGYGWELAPVENPVVQQIGEQEFEADSGLIGAVGTITVRFGAVEKGKQDFQLIYHRPWEVGVPPLETYSLQIEVH
jgi:inhibitor of cysteine peptidase